eukprot:4880974-Prymnesium_polylepis.2
MRLAQRRGGSLRQPPRLDDRGAPRTLRLLFAVAHKVVVECAPDHSAVEQLLQEARLALGLGLGCPGLARGGRGLACVRQLSAARSAAAARYRRCRPVQRTRCTVVDGGGGGVGVSGSAAGRWQLLGLRKEVARLRSCRPAHVGAGEELAKIARLEDAPCELGVLEHIVAQELLEDLPLVHLLLQRASRHKPEDGDGARLADAIGTLSCLAVVGRVPVGVHQHDAVGTRQVDA